MNEVGYWLTPSFPRQRCVVVVIIGTMTPSDFLSVHPPLHFMLIGVCSTPKFRSDRGGYPQFRYLLS